jgi:hypothetical protein
MAEPISWSEQQRADFISYIDEELRDAISNRDPLVQQWIRWLAQYRAPARTATRRFPFEGAANFELPITATDVDQLLAKFLQTIHATDNLWTLSALNERWVNATAPLTTFMTWLDGSILKMYPTNKRALLEMVKLGTAIYKTGWTYERRDVYNYDEQGKVQKFVKIRSLPVVDHVRLNDFVVPPYATAIQPDAQNGAPWVAERHRISVRRLRSLADSSDPLMPAFDKKALEIVIKFEESGATDYDEWLRSMDYDRRMYGDPGTAAASGNGEFEKCLDGAVNTGAGGLNKQHDIELWEIHARFPTKGRFSEDDIIVWYHQPTRTVVRGVYNYFHHASRPYDVVRYFPGDGFYGIGVCEQKEVFQGMASDLFNFTWDNVLLANSRMVVAKSGANISPGEPFYPNKVWIVDEDINKSFGIFPMADIYPSLPMLSQFVQSLGERRTGIADLQLGNLQSLPSRTPATTTMNLLQEGNRRPDLTIKDMRYEGLSNVGLRVLQNCQQFLGSALLDEDGKQLLQIAVDMLGQPEGQEVATKLTTPAENAEFGVGVALTATSGSANKEQQKQSYLALLQLAAQLYPQFIQAIGMGAQAPGTPIADIAYQSAAGLQELFKRVLETYDIRNPETILPLPDQASQPAGAIPGGAAAPGAPAGANGGAAGGASAPPFDPGLAALFSGVNAGL